MTYLLFIGGKWKSKIGFTFTARHSNCIAVAIGEEIGNTPQRPILYPL